MNKNKRVTHFYLPDTFARKAGFAGSTDGFHVGAHGVLVEQIDGTARLVFVQRQLANGMVMAD